MEIHLHLAEALSPAWELRWQTEGGQWPQPSLASGAERSFLHWEETSAKKLCFRLPFPCVFSTGFIAGQSSQRDQTEGWPELLCLKQGSAFAGGSGHWQLAESNAIKSKSPLSGSHPEAALGQNSVTFVLSRSPRAGCFSCQTHTDASQWE